MNRAGIALGVMLAGCALVHERGGDAAPVALDAAPAIDVGPITSCTDFWLGMPSCPATPNDALGQACFSEGQTCGSHCCEPGPPIVCQGGQWHALDHMDDCRGVRCRAPVACFDGLCAFGDVCVRSVGETLARPFCVHLPESNACMLPPISLSTDPTSCTTCMCMPGPEGQSIVTLDCPCC